MALGKGRVDYAKQSASCWKSFWKSLDDYNIDKQKTLNELKKISDRTRVMLSNDKNYEGWSTYKDSCISIADDRDELEEELMRYKHWDRLGKYYYSLDTLKIVIEDIIDGSVNVSKLSSTRRMYSDFKKHCFDIPKQDKVSIDYLRLDKKFHNQAKQFRNVIFGNGDDKLERYVANFNNLYNISTDDQNFSIFVSPYVDETNSSHLKNLAKDMGFEKWNMQEYFQYNKRASWGAILNDFREYCDLEEVYTKEGLCLDRVFAKLSDAYNVKQVDLKGTIPEYLVSVIFDANQYLDTLEETQLIDKNDVDSLKDEWKDELFPMSELLDIFPQYYDDYVDQEGGKKKEYNEEICNYMEELHGCDFLDLAINYLTIKQKTMEIEEAIENSRQPNKKLDKKLELLESEGNVFLDKVLQMCGLKKFNMGEYKSKFYPNESFSDYVMPFIKWVGGVGVSRSPGDFRYLDEASVVNDLLQNVINPVSYFVAGIGEKFDINDEEVNSNEKIALLRDISSCIDCSQQGVKVGDGKISKFLKVLSTSSSAAELIDAAYDYANTPQEVYKNNQLNVFVSSVGLLERSDDESPSSSLSYSSSEVLSIQNEVSTAS